MTTELALFVLATLAAGNIAVADTLPFPSVPKAIARGIVESSVRTSFDAAVRGTYAYAVDTKEQTGILLTTQILPIAAHLLITRKGTRRAEHCSGIAISSNYVLTAAHCVCTQAGVVYFNSTECRPHLNELEIEIVFPERGIYEGSGEIHVHPNFRSPTKIENSQEVADLALIKFPGDFQVSGIKFGKRSGNLLTSNYGLLAFTLDEEVVSGFGKNTGYQAGAQQASRVEEIYEGSDRCGKSNASDTVCSMYNKIAVAAGSAQDATVCGGDSGAPLFQYSHDKKQFLLIGITSYFSPAAASSLCKGEADSRRTHYVNVKKYQKWIHETTGATPHKASFLRRPCVSAVFSPGRLKLSNFRGTVRNVSMTLRHRC